MTFAGPCAGCAQQLALNQPTDVYVRFCVERMQLLINVRGLCKSLIQCSSHVMLSCFSQAGVKPYFVFDGGYLPAKAAKETERRADREAGA
jgi:hypothetical protein